MLPRDSYGTAFVEHLCARAEGLYRVPGGGSAMVVRARWRATAHCLRLVVHPQRVHRSLCSYCCRRVVLHQQRLKQCFEDPSAAAAGDLYTKVVATVRAAAQEHSVSPKDRAPAVRKEEVFAVAGVIKAYFRELADPLVPFEYYAPMIAAARSVQVRALPGSRCRRCGHVTVSHACGSLVWHRTATRA